MSKECDGMPAGGDKPLGIYHEHAHGLGKELNDDFSRETKAPKGKSAMKGYGEDMEGGAPEGDD